MSEIVIRAARTADVKAIHALLEPLVSERVLLGKEMVHLYEMVQEFVVAEDGDVIVGCGALHVMWKHLGEIRTLLVRPDYVKHGIGGRIVEALEERARQLGLKKLFCLTFETRFFSKHGFEPIGEHVVKPDVYAQLLRSPDAGVAEFLELAHVKPNTLGNTRMLKSI